MATMKYGPRDLALHQAGTVRGLQTPQKLHAFNTKTFLSKIKISKKNNKISCIEFPIEFLLETRYSEKPEF